MIKTTLAVTGMICGMCEAHVNDAVRAAFPVKKVSSSRKKGETVILSEKPVDPDKIRRVISGAGYTVVSVREEKAEKSRLFGLLPKRTE